MSPETQQLSVIRELHLGSTYLSSTMKRNIFNSIFKPPMNDLGRFRNFRLFSIQDTTPYKILHEIKKNLYATSINYNLDFGLIVLVILQAHYKNQSPMT